MAIEWYCEIDGNQHGPMSPYDLKELADAGKLQSTHMMWKEGMQKRVPARTVRGLFDGPSGGPATATKPPGASPPPAAVKTQIGDLAPAVKTQIADSVPALKTQIADAPTTAEAGAEHQTWVEKPQTPPKKDDDVVETQVAEDVVETQVAEDVVDTLAAEEPIAKVEAAEPEPVVATEAAPAKRKSSGLRAERERSRREEAEAPRPRDAVPTPAPPVAGKPFRVLAAGRILGPFSLDELRDQLAAGKLGAADLIGVETWLPLASLGGLLFDKVVAQGLEVQRKAVQAAAAELVPAVADDPADLVPAAADELPVVVATVAAPAKPQPPPDDMLVPAAAGAHDDLIHDIPMSQIEEIKETKSEPANKPPEIPASVGDSIPVDDEFKF